MTLNGAFKQHEVAQLLTVTVSPEPTFITESASFLIESLKSLMSLRVHMEAAAMGGNSTNTQKIHQT